MTSGIVGSDTRRKLDPREFGGFALVDPHAPVVFVNGADSKAAQVFTLADELAHVWLGATALSDLDPRALRSNQIERWCNQVAAEFLVPINEFRARFDRDADLRAQLQPLAEHFRVSTQVILGRAREAGALTWEEYLAELDVEHPLGTLSTLTEDGSSSRLRGASSTAGWWPRSPSVSAFALLLGRPTASQPRASCRCRTVRSTTRRSRMRSSSTVAAARPSRVCGPARRSVFPSSGV